MVEHGNKHIKHVQLSESFRLLGILSKVTLIMSEDERQQTIVIIHIFVMFVPLAYPQ